MDPHDTSPPGNDDEPIWPEMSTNISTARSVARAITLDTQKASTDGRVMELTSQLETVTTRIAELEKLITAQRQSADAATQLSSDLAAVRSDLLDTNSRIDGHMSSIESASAQLTADLEEQVHAIDDRVTTAEGERIKNSQEVANLMGYLEQAYERLDGLNARIDEVAELAQAGPGDEIHAEFAELSGSMEELRHSLDAAQSEYRSRVESTEQQLRTDVSSAEEALARQVAEVQDQLRAQVIDAEQNLADQVAEARSHLHNRAVDSDQNLQQRLAGLASSEELDLRFRDLSDRLDDAHHRLDDTGADDEILGQLNTLQARIDEAHHRLDDTGADDEILGQLNTLQARIDEAGASVDDLRRIGDELRKSNDEAWSQINEIRNDDGSLHDQIDELRRRVDDVASTAGSAITDEIAAIIQRTDATHEELSSIRTSTEELWREVGAVKGTDPTERVDELAHRTDDVVQRLEEMAGRIDSVSTMVDEANAAIGESTGWSAEADEVVSSLSARIDEYRGGADESRSMIEDLRIRTDSAAEQAAGAVAEVEGLRTAVESTHELAADASERIDSTLDRIGENQERIQATAAQVDGLLDQVSAVEARTEETAASLDTTMGRIDGVESTSSDLERRLTEGQQRTDAAIEASNQERDSLAERIDEARAQLAREAESTKASLAEQVERAETTLADQVAESRSLLAGQIADSEDRLGRRMEESDERIDAIGDLEEKVVRANLKATEAHQFSENLRILQTDLVKAIQSELDMQSARLNHLDAAINEADDEPGLIQRLMEAERSLALRNAEITELRGSQNVADARVEHLEATIASITSLPPDELGIAPAPRLDIDRLVKIEERLGETAASVESLAELQRRTTNLDTSLTQSMSNLTDAIEQNNAELTTLRRQLDEANSRIAELEAGEPAAASPFDAVEPVPPLEVIGDSDVDSGSPFEVDGDAFSAPSPFDADDTTETVAGGPESPFDSMPPPVEDPAAHFDPTGLDDAQASTEGVLGEIVELEPNPGEATPKSMPVTDVIGETIRDELLTPRDDSDWFIASYAKRDQSAKPKKAEESDEESDEGTGRKKRRFFR